MISPRLLPLLLVPLVCGFMQDEWKLIAPDKRFSIEIPGMTTPEEGLSTPANGQNAGGKMWAGRAGFLYIVSYVNLSQPVPTDRKDVREVYFKSMLRMFAHDEKYGDYEIISQKPVKLGKLTGREFKTKGRKPGDASSFFVTTRMFLKSKRVYAIGVTSSSDEMDNEVSKRFFNSFKILKP